MRDCGALQVDMREDLGIFGQWLGGVLVGIGVGIELSLGADIGYVIITMGSLIYAAATKIRRK